MKKLSCFVACAFGRADVDELYDSKIEPLLTTHKLQPRRVDRIIHNDDIDNKILELIDSCDFCIADLTYARPSVYYEAGRVHGMGKPVIFTARRDHFKDKENDPNGNLRVHFDLQMKNIIEWPNSDFGDRLSKRISTVSAPLLKRQDEQTAQLQARKAFSCLSIVEQQSKVSEYVHSALSQKGFKILECLQLWRHGHKVAFKLTDTLLHVVFIRTFMSVRQSNIDIYEHLPSSILEDEPRFHQLMRSKNVRLDVVACSLKTVPLGRIRQALPQFERYEESDSYGIALRTRENVEEAYIHFVHPIRSMKELQDKWETIPALLESQLSKVIDRDRFMG